MLLRLLSVNESAAELPVSTLPKVRPFGVAASCGCTPMPVSATLSGSGVADVATESVPERVLACVGVKATVMSQEAPGARLPPAEQMFKFAGEVVPDT